AVVTETAADGLVGRDVGPFEVLAAPRAQAPVETDEPSAVGAYPVEPRAARRADDPFLVDPAVAGRARLDRLDLREEGLLREVALVDLGDLLLGPDDPVDDDPEHEQDRREQDDQRRGQVGEDRVLAPELHVPERPVRRREPEDAPVDGDRLDGQLDDGVREEVPDRLTDRVEDLVHAVAWASAVGG